MTRLEFGQAKCMKCKESDETLSHVDLPWGNVVLCKPCKLGEYKKIALENVRTGISDMRELYGIHLKVIAPYSLESLNDMTAEKFIKSMRDTMLFTEEWLKKYEEIESKRV